MHGSVAKEEKQQQLGSIHQVEYLNMSVMIEYVGTVSQLLSNL